MLSIKAKGNKNAIYLSALAVIIIIAGLVYYFFFGSNDQAVDANGLPSGQGSVTAVKRLEIKKINLDIFSYDNFTGLKDYQPLYKNKRSYSPGNNSPFLSGDQ